MVHNLFLNFNIRAKVLQMILKTNIHQQNFSFLQIFPSRSLSVNILPVSLHNEVGDPPQFETHPTPPCLGRESCFGFQVSSFKIKVRVIVNG